MPGRQAWGDDDDDDYLPPRQESAVDSKGVKSIVEYHFNTNGAKVKRTTKVKVFTEHTRVHKSCLERTQWNKFGLAAQVDDNASYTIKSMEEIRMETPQESREADEKPNSMEDTLKEAMERMRRKHAMRTAGLLESTNEAAPPEDEAKGGMGMMGLGVGGAGKYVPPSRKVGFSGRGESGPEGAANPMAMGEDHTKIRVTNISEDTTEGDLRDLFSAFGRINRVYLAKDPETMQSRGFAFVSYYQKSDAESAMQALQGYGYDHLILKLEWAKPSLRDVATEGGLSGMRTSGYGERLAQDTKQQVSYASNLTR
ncbi:unnamed protein product [Ectocarpus sp. 6 AP-2014]